MHKLLCKLGAENHLLHSIWLGLTNMDKSKPFKPKCLIDCLFIIAFSLGESCLLKDEKMAKVSSE